MKKGYKEDDLKMAFQFLHRQFLREDDFYIANTEEISEKRHRANIVFHKLDPEHETVQKWFSKTFEIVPKVALSS